MFVLSGWKVYAAGALMLVAAYGGHQVTAWQKDAKYSALMASNAQAMQAYADRAAKAETAQRDIETQRATDRDRIEDDTRKQIDDARTAAAAASGELGRLRTQLTNLATRQRGAGTHPAADGTGSGIAGGDPLDMLVGMLTRHTGELVEVGRFADKLRVAGLACERKYDSLTRRF